MLRTLPYAFTAALLCAGMSAQAAQVVTTIPVNDPRVAHAKIVAAATQVCRDAIAHDDFGDFGSLDECVEDSVAMVKTVPSSIRLANAAK